MGTCEQHGIEKRPVPAGVSKRTGKPYPAFEVCELCQADKRPVFSASGTLTERGKESIKAVAESRANDSIAKMAQDKRDSIEKMHETKMRAECLRAAAEICVATKQTDFQQIIDVAESYWKWLKDETSAIPF